MSTVPTILLIVPDPTDRARLAQMLEPHGYPVLHAESGTLARTSMPPPGSLLVIVLDLAGVDALRYLRGPAATRGNAPVIALSDRRQIGSAAEALRLGVADLVGRPVHESDLLAAIANAREFGRTAWQPAAVMDAPAGGAPIENVVAVSPAIRDVLAMVRRVAAIRCAVLLTGERGTGREMVARSIHAQGATREAPFVKIVCSGASADLVERLFSGTLAAGSTVYLENLQELTPDLQVRLGEQIRSEADVPADATAPGQAGLRFIGAASPRIFDPADRNQVRRELIDALGIVRIELPPLRQRVDDIPLLATHFLKEACLKHQLPTKAFSRSSLLLLAVLPWPGNIEELRSVAERLAVIVPRGMVLLEDVLNNIRFDGAEAMGRARGTLREAREGFERDYIVSVLQHHHGRMGAAAKELGIERTNLYRKIKQLRITWTVAAD